MAGWQREGVRAQVRKVQQQEDAKKEAGQEAPPRTAADEPRDDKEWHRDRPNQHHEPQQDEREHRGRRERSPAEPRDVLPGKGAEAPRAGGGEHLGAHARGSSKNDARASKVTCERSGIGALSYARIGRVVGALSWPAYRRAGLKPHEIVIVELPIECSLQGHAQPRVGRSASGDA